MVNFVNGTETNSTVTVTSISTSTSTVTSTVHQTVTQGGAILTANPGGIPFTLWAFFAFLAIVGVYIYFRTSVKTIPSILIWLFHNYQAKKFAVQEDLNGLFLYVKDARGRKIETLKKTGQPVDVIDVTRAKAYLLTFTDRERQKWKKSHPGQELPPEMAAGTDAYKPAVYLDVSVGGLKHERMFLAVEGTGQTLDIIDKIDGAKSTDTGNSSVMHELRSAAKEILKIDAETMKSIGNSFIFIALGLAGGVCLTLVFMLFGGHYR